jgi:hypothetical protein
MGIYPTLCYVVLCRYRPYDELITCPRRFAVCRKTDYRTNGKWRGEKQQQKTAIIVEAQICNCTVALSRKKRLFWES